MIQSNTIQIPVNKINASGESSVNEDFLAIEEPLEIRLEFSAENQRITQSISITMRTPGNDFDLALGFLFTEGIINNSSHVESIKHCDAQNNVVKISLPTGLAIDVGRLQRNFYTSSSCGVCGKTSIEALQMNACPTLTKTENLTHATTIHVLPEKLRAAQSVFDSTGGLHAAGLFDADGNLMLLREDVGRHNAVDKVIGAQFQNQLLPLHDKILLVSGRASFELVQKALMAGIPVLAAVGAPSSLAVELANNFGMSLIGFVRDQRFNIYSHPERIVTTISSAGDHIQTAQY
jgi:FdhD protein